MGEISMLEKQMIKIAATIILTTLFAGQAAAAPDWLRNGEAGFVVSSIKYALGPDAADAGTCPDGMTRNMQEIYAETPAGKRQKGEGEEEHLARIQKAGWALGYTADGKNLCMNPEVGPRDPYYKSVVTSSVPVEGIDLDSQDGSGDFPGLNGERGIDNQFYRVVGCSRSFQSTGQSNGFDIEMLAGAWGIVVTLSGVDDIYNDDNVDVGIYANADPIQLSPSREPLPYATYAIDQNPRFRSQTRGRIVDGVLKTEPVDVRFHHAVNSMLLERPLKAAVIQAILTADGLVDGYLAGYAPVEEFYDHQFGFRNGRASSGDLAPLALRLQTSNGAAFVLGHTCHGAYQALYQHADAYPDSDGRFTAISTQYRIQAIPAFAVDIKTESSNAELAKSMEYRRNE